MSDWPYPRWVAHRGAGKLAPENTLAAFRLGASKEEIVEVLQSAYFHTGALTLVHGMIALIDVLKEMEEEKKTQKARPRARHRRS